MDTDQLLADSLDQQSCNNGRVNAAGQCQQDLLVANLLADSGDLLSNKCISKLWSGNALHRIGSYIGIHSNSS